MTIPLGVHLFFARLYNRYADPRRPTYRPRLERPLWWILYHLPPATPAKRRRR